MNAPPLLVSFSTIDTLVEALPQLTRATYEAEIRSLVEKGLPPATSIRTLSTLFGVSSEFIGSMIRVPQRYYRIFKIQKGKKKRQIQAPRVALKIIQKWVGSHLESAIHFQECVYGFIHGRSVVDAARVHCGAKWIYSLDIRDFFPSTTAQQVFDGIRNLGYSDHGAQVITRLCTLNGRLPQGSPASPVLSNLVFAPYDIELQAIANAEGIRYTRYADDIVFSGQSDPPADLAERVKKIITDAGWEVAPEKECLIKHPARLKVHGLVVHGTAPRLTKGYRNRIRAFRHLLAAGKIRDADFQRVRGHLAYANFVAKSEPNN